MNFVGKGLQRAPKGDNFEQLAARSVYAVPTASAVGTVYTCLTQCLTLIKIDAIILEYNNNRPNLLLAWRFSG